MQVLRLGRVMAVAIDNHGTIAHEVDGRDATGRGTIVKPGLPSVRMRPAQGETCMADIPRLNNIIRALEQGQHALTAFTPADVESAIALATSKYDGVVYEMEHNPYDIRAFRDCMQYMLNRRQIAQSGSLAPTVTPMVRIPPNGGEKAQWQAKQVFDIGAYGIIWPHISSVEEAYNAVAAC